MGHLGRRWPQLTMDDSVLVVSDHRHQPVARIDQFDSTDPAMMETVALHDYS